jgi:HEAT repeats
VRRRAALAAALHSPDEAGAVLTALAQDEDPGVREAVAAGAAALSVPPRALLLRLAQDPETRVRRAALRALSAPQALADLPAAERRKALRELLSGGELPRANPPADIDPSLPPQGTAVEAQPAEEGAAPRLNSQLDLEGVERELRASLRGRTAEQLSEILGTDPLTLTRALEAEGARFVLRGSKWFVS